ncbi:MAG TPA: DUF2889 domain-containing protein [Burkholderiales bacterium]|nr:DUF2889 domain-containing protein [Burkholderiales bacterium]
MALPAPASRELLHKRIVECFGYRRDDGLFDIEGHLLDVKAYDIHDLDRSPIRAGEPLHEMWLRLTLDLDMNVVEVEAHTVHGPYAICGDIVPNFQCLKGLTIQGGWTQKTRELLGGTQGCTHLVELLGPIATTAFQTVYAARQKRDRDAGIKKPPALLDSCHAWASDSPVIARRYPEYYTGPKAGSQD